ALRGLKLAMTSDQAADDRNRSGVDVVLFPSPEHGPHRQLPAQDRAGLRIAS
ncbi:unnamed protein product, partial [Gadus morhua 'NCC']